MYSKTLYESGTKYEVSYSWGRVAVNVQSKSNLADLSIYVEEEYRGKGYSRQLVRDITYYMQGEEPTELYIDTDASGGFWQKVGMLPNPKIDDYNSCQHGYEKFILWKDFKTFGFPKTE